MAGVMHGLNIYIGDIKVCTSKAGEKKRVFTELAKIRKRFDEKNLSGYNRKKYTWKLIYTYMLGYDVNFGHSEIMLLINSSKFSEKCTGYIAAGLLLNEYNISSLENAIPAIKHDLLTYDEVSTSLALSTLANIGGKYLAENVGKEIKSIAFSKDGIASLYIKKKACACLLSLLRKNKAVFDTEQWALNFEQLLKSKSMGVMLASSALILYTVQNYPNDSFAGLAPLIVENLLKIYKNEFNYLYEYKYYSVFCPWLQVRFMKILQFLPPVKDRSLDKLNEVLQMMITKTDTDHVTSKSNAAFGVLFESINLAIQYKDDTSSSNRRAVLGLLCKFIGVKEPNIRYLALDALTRFQGTEVNNYILKEYHKTILASLRDPDISIRKRALDVLFILCNKEYSMTIVNELIIYLQEKDHFLKEELVLKIALLAEKFASSIEWYIDIILKAIEYAGDYISDDIWFRVVQIITGIGKEVDPEMQKYAALKIFYLLSTEYVHNTIVKLGSHIIAHYGILIKDIPGKDLNKQLGLLIKHYNNVDNRTRAMILSSITRLAMQDSSLKEQVIGHLMANRGSINSEIQQRSLEYCEMLQNENFQGIASVVFAKAPSYPESQMENPLMKKLVELKSTKMKGDKSKEISLNLEANFTMSEGLTKSNSTTEKSTQEVVRKSEKSDKPEPTPFNLIEDFKTMSTNTDLEQNEIYKKHNTGFSKNATIHPDSIPKFQVPSNFEFWKQLIMGKNASGQIYANDYITVDAQCQFKKHLGNMTLSIKSKVEQGISKIEGKATIPDGIDSRQSKFIIPANQNEAHMVMLQIMNKNSFSTCPLYIITCTTENERSSSFGIPIIATKFIDPLPISNEEFLAKWNELESSTTAKRGDFIFKNPAPKTIAIPDVLKKMAVLFKEYFNLSVIPPTAEHFSILNFAGVMHLKPEQAKFPSISEEFDSEIVRILVQVELYEDIEVNEFRFSIRSEGKINPCMDLVSLYKYFINPKS